MKNNILVIDEDIDYSKKFCNQGNKLYGDRYLFLHFSSLKSVKEYIEENKHSSLVVSSSYAGSIDDVSGGSMYVLSEDDKSVKKDGRRTYIYKLQNVKNILSVISDDLEKKDGKVNVNQGIESKLVVFYAVDYIKNKYELVKRIAKYISKKKKILIVDLDEFGNYKGKTGLSNIIFNYKEDKLDVENIEKEIEIEKNLLYIKSTTYPEDFNVVNNVDLANIMSKVRELPYDYIFVNADMSYTKNQYILNDADMIVLFKDGNSERIDKVKTHLRNENSIDISKIYEMNLSKMDREYLMDFSKGLLE